MEEICGFTYRAICRDVVKYSGTMVWFDDEIELESLPYFSALSHLMSDQTITYKQSSYTRAIRNYLVSIPPRSNQCLDYLTLEMYIIRLLSETHAKWCILNSSSLRDKEYEQHYLHLLLEFCGWDYMQYLLVDLHGELFNRLQIPLNLTAFKQTYAEFCAKQYNRELNLRKVKTYSGLFNHIYRSCKFSGELSQPMLRTLSSPLHFMKRRQLIGELKRHDCPSIRQIAHFAQCASEYMDLPQPHYRLYDALMEC